MQLSQLHQPSKSQGVHLSQVHQPSNQCTNVLYDVVVLTYVTPSSSQHSTKLEQKKSKKADLERKRPLWFLIGLFLPALLFFALLELVTWSASRDVSDKDLDDFLEEMEHRPKNEREDMVAAMDAHQQPKATERVKVVDERKEMEKLKTITDMRIVGDDDDVQPTDKHDHKKDEPKAAAVDMGDNPLNFRIVEQLPEFPGGMSAYVKWLTKNLKYPLAAQKQKIEGRVVVSFVINRDGSLTDIKVSKSANPILDSEALRVAKMMPKWKPGLNNNKPCRTLFAVPIDFKL